jgi:hypothetical protein
MGEKSGQYALNIYSITASMYTAPKYNASVEDALKQVLSMITCLRPLCHRKKMLARRRQAVMGCTQSRTPFNFANHAMNVVFFQLEAQNSVYLEASHIA